MEDEHRVLASGLSNNLPSETQVEESFEEEDGGEIMVEVVGSDVLVDGVSGNKESDFEPGEVRDLEGHVWENREGPDGTQNFLEAMDVSTKGDENNLEETELKLSVSRDEKSCDVSKEVGVNCSEGGSLEGDLKGALVSRGVSGSGDKVRNLGADAMDVLSSDVVVEAATAVSGEDKRDNDESVKDNAAEAVVDKAVVDKVGVVEREEELLSIDNAAGHECLGGDSGSSHGAGVRRGEVVPSEGSFNPSCEQPNDVQADGINSVVGEGGSVNADARREVLATDEHATTDAPCEEEVKLIEQKEGFTEAKLIVNSQAVVSDGVGEDQGCLNDFHGKELDHGTDDVSHAVGVESGSINDGASGINQPDSSSVGNEKYLKTDDLETDPIHENHAISNEPSQFTDGIDTAEVSKDKGLTVVNGVKAAENQPNMTTPSCPEDSGIHENQTVNASPVGETIGDQKAAIHQAQVVDGDGSNEIGEKVDSEMSKRSLECHGRAEIPAVGPSTENMDFSEQGTCPNVESSDAMATDSHATVNSQAGSENVVEEQQVFVQIAETPSDEAQKHESINLTPKEISSDGAVSDITEMSMLPEITENAELPLTDIVEKVEGDDNCSKPDGLCFVEGQNSDVQLMDFDEERDTDRTYHGGMADLGTEEPITENENLIFFSEGLQMNISGYLLPTEDEGHFSVLDLVWGKVRSHPWWPGQIFDPADASEKAVKYYKKDAYLIAYFGDQTFAWNDASELKPFRSHFSQIEKQNNSEAFQNAVNCAVGEVSRRIELGLSCPCIPKDAYSEIKTQVIENAGIREESSQQYGVDRSSQATYFEPDKLLDYIKDLARHASFGADRLDLVIARAQLSAFCRLKGYRLPTGFPSTGELLENDADTEQISDPMSASLKRKHTPDNDSQSRKEKSLTEIMGERESSPEAEDDSLSSGRKRKALDSLPDGSAAKTPTMSQTPRPSFKIGECIRRVASQLTGATPLVKGSNDETVADGSPRIYDHSERRSVVFSAESFSSDEILSQLQLLALEPKKGENILNNIHNFLMGFRNSIALNRRGRKKRADSAVGGSGEEFEFDDVNDSYWTDRIVHNYPEEQLVNNSESREGNLQLVAFSEDKTVKPGRKSRKRYSSMNYPTVDSEIEENAKRKKQESSPAELILNFAERNCLPSEINLNKMFRRFGPLMESETEVDHDSGRAKVIFKRGSDAEVARNSSERFNIFGPVLVNYQIGYSPLISVKISPLALPQSQEDVTLLI